MTRTLFDNVSIRSYRIPSWSLILIAAVAFVVVAVTGLLWLSVLILMTPILLVASGLQRLRHSQQPVPMKRKEPRNEKPARVQWPLIIEGDYVVVDEEPKPTRVPPTPPNDGKRLENAA